MTATDLLTAASRLTAAPLRRLVTGLRDLIGQAIAGAEVALLIADYRHDTLVPADGAGADVPVDDGPPGRCYVLQRTERERADGRSLLWLPVSIHGDRLGVLHLDLPVEDVSADHLAVLEALARITARTLRAAVTVSDGYLVARRVRALTVAAEMQWSLLPGNSFADEHVVVAGQLEPAYAATGDAYDWSRSPDGLLVAVFDAPGRGIEASLRTALAVSAFRNARRGGFDLEEVVSLTDQALYDAGGGAWTLPAAFLHLDFTDGSAHFVNAGSPLALRRRGDDVRPLELDEQLPLGMFQGTLYAAERVDVREGDRLLVVTDGIERLGHEGQEAYVTALGELMHATADRPVWETVRRVIGTVVDAVGGDALDQDVVAVGVDVL